MGFRGLGAHWMGGASSSSFIPPAPTPGTGIPDTMPFAEDMRQVRLRRSRSLDRLKRIQDRERRKMVVRKDEAGEWLQRRTTENAMRAALLASTI